jgi:hypothetical protein
MYGYWDYLGIPPLFSTSYIASLGDPPIQPPVGRHFVKNCSDKSMSLLAP